MLVIKTDVTYTVTHQTTHILPPAGTQNALDESQKKASTQQAARSITLLARCRRAHGARLGRWRSQKHRWWPSAGVSGGGRDLTIRADDPTSRNPTRANNPTQPKKHDSEVGPSALSSWVAAKMLSNPRITSAVSPSKKCAGGAKCAVWRRRSAPAPAQICADAGAENGALLPAPHTRFA